MSASILALASSCHLVFVALRTHRSSDLTRRSLLVLVSLALSVSPWLTPRATAIAAGLVAHLAWFILSDRWAMASSAAGQASAGAADANSAGQPGEEDATVAGDEAGQSGPAPQPSAPPGFNAVPVLAIFDETPDIRTFRLLRPEGYDLQAGQFVAVRLKVDGRDLVRCYSVSSAPEAVGYLEISVKRQGAVSSALHSVLRPGSMLQVCAPTGPFVYRRTTVRWCCSRAAWASPR